MPFKKRREEKQKGKDKTRQGKTKKRKEKKRKEKKKRGEVVSWIPKTVIWSLVNTVGYSSIGICIILNSRQLGN